MKEKENCMLITHVNMYILDFIAAVNKLSSLSRNCRAFFFSFNSWQSCSLWNGRRKERCHGAFSFSFLFLVFCMKALHDRVIGLPPPPPTAPPLSLSLCAHTEGRNCTGRRFLCVQRETFACELDECRRSTLALEGAAQVNTYHLQVSDRFKSLPSPPPPPRLPPPPPPRFPPPTPTLRLLSPSLCRVVEGRGVLVCFQTVSFCSKQSRLTALFVGGEGRWYTV